ncbi:MAG: glycosyltransferase family 2 protein, partial [Saprospiraceae bacterium]|nr:glycosyltransferase family 2 protein [Saprospiraceae bacterium]
MQTNYFTDRAFTGPLIEQPPDPGLGMCIVIPVCDEPDLVHTLESLASCLRPTGLVEVLVVVNHGASAPDRIKASNRHLVAEVESRLKVLEHGRLTVHLIRQFDLPAKKAGVGLARKIGMDEAARRAWALGRSEIPVVCLDADCTVSANYLRELESFFHGHPAIEGCSIHFEHPLDGLDSWQCAAIVQYELHLRCMIGWQRWAAFPFAFQTVGSSMAVRAQAYVEVGGMNTRKAGEDFYFLHKVIERGKFADCTGCTVYPAARVSDRVPFGTGRTILQAREGRQICTHHPDLYRALRMFFERLELLWRPDSFHQVEDGLPEILTAYLEDLDWKSRVEQIRAHTSSRSAFVKRCFRWFNAFRVMKFAHFAR